MAPHAAFPELYLYTNNVINTLMAKVSVSDCQEVKISHGAGFNSRMCVTGSDKVEGKIEPSTGGLCCPGEEGSQGKYGGSVPHL